MIPFGLVDYAIMLGEFFKKMDTQLVYLGVDGALSRDFYKDKMSHLGAAIERFHSSATSLQSIIQVRFLLKSNPLISRP